MRAIAIADDDSLVGHLDASSVDVLISLGDLWDATIEGASDGCYPNRILAVRGNHDSDALFQSFITPLHLTVESCFGMTFGGFNGSWRYKPRGHHLFDQAEVVRLLRSFPAVDVFVAHNSPKGFHERDDDVHQGFDGFLNYIERTQPRYFIHGHQHLNMTTKIGETTLIGVFGEAIIEIGTNSGQGSQTRNSRPKRKRLRGLCHSLTPELPLRDSRICVADRPNFRSATYSRRQRGAR